ncbi:MAG TPA: hypothetical protein VF174_16090 [Micromonosporaceae bacterium]
MRAGHTDWCARDHRCNLAEHRAKEIVVALPGHGRATLTRVRDDNGCEYAEVRIRVALVPVESTARRQLLTLLAGLRDLITATGSRAYRRAAS